MVCSALDTAVENREDLNLIDKTQVAHSFSRAASSYDKVAGLQRRIGHRLLALAPGAGVGQVLDLGCGTGYFARLLADHPANRGVVALDLAEGMLDYARSNRPHSNIRWLCGDAEQLPLANGCLDGAFTSLAIQWCEDLPRLFGELRRVLKPGGRLVFATLGPDTLWELREAWRRVDEYVHVNRFQSRDRVLGALAGRLEVELFEEQQIELQYQQVRELTGELKGLGAHNVNSGRIQGLAGRRRVQAFRAAYEAMRTPAGYLPATYQVYYAIVRKPF